MPIRPELRPLYPPHWRELSARVRVQPAGGRRQVGTCDSAHVITMRPRHGSLTRRSGADR